MNDVESVSALLAWLLLPLLNGGPDEPPGIEEDPGEDVAWADPFASTDDTIDERPLKGHLLPSLVTLEDPTVSLQADGLMSPREHYEGPATIVVAGTLSHPFDDKVRDIEIRATFIPLDELDHVWRRLMAPPLELTQRELEQRLPMPEFILESRVADVVDTDSPIDIAVSSDFEDLELDPRALPTFVGAVVSYRLDEPSSDDLRRIIEAGGIPDLRALGAWVAEHDEGEPIPFATEECRMLVRVAATRLRAMRAPPAHGDFQRVHALLELIRILAEPEDLELLLELERPMEILLMSAALSYQGALVEEATLELPVHGLRDLPSSSRLLRAYRNAMSKLRLESLPQLLRLAYDPIDYAQTPDPDFEKSKVQFQARKLLEPLSPTRVMSILNAVDGEEQSDLDAQRQILQFYVDIKFVAAVEPMMRWLLQHPEETKVTAKNWARSLGRLVVPTLLRYFVDPIGPGEEELAREMLLSLDPDAAGQVVASLRAQNVPMPRDANIQTALAAFEARRNEDNAKKATSLAAELFEGDEDVLSLSGRLRAAEQLAHIAPSQLFEESEKTIELLAMLAMELDSDSPVESERALHLLETLAFPERTRADDEVAMVKASIAIAHSEYREGLDLLLERRPHLEPPRLRHLYADTIERWIVVATDIKDFGLAESLLEEAREHIPEEKSTIDSLAMELFVARYWPALVLGALFGLTMLGTTIWLLVRGLKSALRMLRDAQARGERRRRREAHLIRAEAELNRLASEDGNKTSVGLVSPFDDDLAGEEEDDDDDPFADETLDPEGAGIQISPPPPEADAAAFEETFVGAANEMAAPEPLEAPENDEFTDDDSANDEDDEDDGDEAVVSNDEDARDADDDADGDDDTEDAPPVVSAPAEEITTDDEDADDANDSDDAEDADDVDPVDGTEDADDVDRVDHTEDVDGTEDVDTDDDETPIVSGPEGVEMNDDLADDPPLGAEPGEVEVDDAILHVPDFPEFSKRHHASALDDLPDFPDLPDFDSLDDVG